MKYIKTFESINSPEPGDYIKMRTDSHNLNLYNFLDNNIGQVLYIDSNYVKVGFEEEPPHVSANLFTYDDIHEQYVKLFNIKKIVDFARTEEELIKQLKYNTIKYNL